MPQTTDATVHRFWLALFLVERDWEVAVDYFSSPEMETVPMHPGARPRSLLTGLLHYLSGDTDRARPDLEDAVRILERWLGERPDEPGIHGPLGLAYAVLGHHAEARRMAQRAVEIYGMDRDHFFGAAVVIDSAWIFTILGDHDAALDDIERVISVPSYFSPALIESDARWDPLRNHPRYRGILERHRDLAE